MEHHILYKIMITGRVQGVGFRHSARSNARFFGITGYVKNEPDGSVYIEAEGSRNQLDEFVGWCRKGPGFGHVDDIRIDTALPKNYTSFEIRF
jgi:acylphosphatase